MESHHFFEITGEELYRRLEPKIVAEIGIQTIDAFLGHYASIYPPDSRERALFNRHMLSIQTRLCMLGRLASEDASPNPTISILQVRASTQAQYIYQCDQSLLIMAGRDYHRLIPQLCVRLVFKYLLMLLEQSIISFKRDITLPRLRAWVNDCHRRFYSMLHELRPLMVSQPYYSFLRNLHLAKFEMELWVSGHNPG